MLEKFSTDENRLSELRKEEIRSAIEDIKSKMDRAAEKSPYKQKPRLLLATKTRTPEEINFATSLGVDLIGENRVQELLDKYDKIAKD